MSQSVNHHTVFSAGYWYINHVESLFWDNAVHHTRDASNWWKVV